MPALLKIKGHVWKNGDGQVIRLYRKDNGELVGVIRPSKQPISRWDGSRRVNVYGYDAKAHRGRYAVTGNNHKSARWSTKKGLCSRLVAASWIRSVLLCEPF